MDEARPAFLASLRAFQGAAAALDDFTLLGSSRAHGWSRLDCLTHVRMCLQELLAGIPSRADTGPDVDAASYWLAWEADADEDPIPGILMTRRTSSAYARPTHALEHLNHVTTGLQHTVPTLADHTHRFQGHVITTGDLLATWAVEIAVHHHDLDVPFGAPGPAPSAARIGRRTVEALRGQTGNGRTNTDDLRYLLEGFNRL